MNDILKMYGRDTPKPQAARADSGGCKTTRDVMGYASPQGPTNINDTKGPGLHGNNYGNAGSQGKSSLRAERSGSPGLHGRNMGKDGSQR